MVNNRASKKCKIEISSHKSKNIWDNHTQYSLLSKLTKGDNIMGVSVKYKWQTMWGRIYLFQKLERNSWYGNIENLWLKYLKCCDVSYNFTWTGLFYMPRSHWFIQNRKTIQMESKKSQIDHNKILNSNLHAKR